MWTLRLFIVFSLIQYSMSQEKSNYSWKVGLALKIFVPETKFQLFMIGLPEYWENRFSQKKLLHCETEFPGK